MANPRVIKDFAGAFLQRSKTDSLDAAVILEFVKRMPFQAWQAPPVEILQLRAISRRITALTGSRAAPDEVAARAHYLALVSGDLAGSYNDVGRRQWWGRSRSALGGVSPRAALGSSWQPDGPTARRVADLAAALAGPGSAT